MTRRIVSCYFGYRDWGRLAAVLRATVAQQCPGWVLDLAHLPYPPQVPGRGQGETANTRKLEYWAASVDQSQDGDEVLLIDADTAIVRPLDDLWERPFDVAYTTKPGAALPFNAGVVFLRVNPKTRAFMARWLAENRRLYESKSAHLPLKQKYAGMNQAALGSLIQQGLFPGDLNVLELPCREWNCEDSSWARFDPAVTRILHVKSTLRSHCTGSYLCPPELKAARDWWLAQERAARLVEARAS